MTPFLHDIFSKKKFKIKQTLKPKIIIDHREKNSLVVSELIKLGFETEIKELKVADYIVKDVAIERKTISDFISSMINRRLLNQLEELQQYKNKLLIIEGLEEQELYSDDENVRFPSDCNKEIAVPYKEGKSKKTARLSSGVNSNAVRGFLLSILLKHKIPIIFTKNPEDTAKFILILSRKQEKETSLNPKKKSKNKKEQLQFIVEGFPGIGPATAKKLLKKFKTIKNIINASEEELEEILGKKSEIFKKIVEDKYQ